MWIDGLKSDLNIPNQLGLSLVVDWAREADCSHDHKLIANCLDFLDSEDQVSSANLSPNILYYLPTFYHFEAQRIKLIKTRILLT